MDLRLIRFERSAQGIFSHLTDMLGHKICESVTHSYQQAEGSWVAKTPAGRWHCIRGQHSLNGVVWFETFMIDVPGHVGLLFHQGNVETESKGCELLGMYKGELDGEEAVLHSADAFDVFMRLQTGVNEFILEVYDNVDDVQNQANATAPIADDLVQRVDRDGSAQPADGSGSVPATPGMDSGAGVSLDAGSADPGQHLAAVQDQSAA